MRDSHSTAVPTTARRARAQTKWQSQGVSAGQQRRLNIATRSPTISGDAELRAEGARRLRQRRGHKDIQGTLPQPEPSAASASVRTCRTRINNESNVVLPGPQRVSAGQGQSHHYATRDLRTTLAGSSGYECARVEGRRLVVSRSVNSVLVAGYDGGVVGVAVVGDVGDVGEAFGLAAPTL